MFYCEECRIKNMWPEAFSRSHGKCECCDTVTRCHDRPSSSLPPVRRTPAEPAPASTGRDALSYGPVHVVADLVRNLLTLDQSAPIYSAFHVGHQGQRRCRTRGVMTSWERVIDGKWVDPARTDVPYAVIVWAKPEQDEAAPVAARELDVEAERRELDAEMDAAWQAYRKGRLRPLADAVLFCAGFRAARSAAQGTQPESAQVSTEQAGDAWGVGSCACQACNPHMVGRMMFICPTCGDKRCPHAANHVLNCLGRAPSPNNSPVGADRRE